MTETPKDAITLIDHIADVLSTQIDIMRGDPLYRQQESKYLSHLGFLKELQALCRMVENFR